MAWLTDGQWERCSVLIKKLKTLTSGERETKLRSLQARGNEDTEVLSIVATYFMLPPEPDRDRKGERIDKYVLGNPIAYGGMGVVYRARQENLERDVALKLIDPHLLANDRDDAVERFYGEIKTLAKLEGRRGIVTIHDGGSYHDPATGNTPYCVMQLIEGAVPISTFAWEHELSIKQRLDLFVRVCEAVDFAHFHNIVHRDLKPGNILVDRDAEPYVIDFGLSQVLDPWIVRERRTLASGTPAYMSPEQIAGDRPVGPKSDVYALGVMLYELLTRQRPYEVSGDSYEDIRDAILRAAPNRIGKFNKVLRNCELETYLVKALAKDPDDRCTLLGLKAAIERYEPPTKSVGLIGPSQEDKRHSPNPYRGLQIFHRQHAPYFFGRESLVDELQTRLEKQALLTVVGASGSGKSSLIFAGLVPRLDREDCWLIAEMRPQSEPFQQLGLALAPHIDTDVVRQFKAIKELAKGLYERTIDLADIIAVIGNRFPSKRLLLIVDQFEELYTQRSDSEQPHRFIEVLLTAINAHSQPYGFALLLTLRADFMGHVLRCEQFAEALSRYPEMIVRPLTRPELTAAIEGPAYKQGVELEAGLAERILRDVRQAPGNLPLLQFALTELWDRQDRGELTHAAYEAIGGVERSLTRHADAVYARFSEDEQQRLRRIFDQLVSPGDDTEDSRQIATRDHIGEDDWPLALLLAEEETRLVVVDRRGDDETLELVHEALIRHWPPLRRWLREDREFRLWQQRLRQAIRDWEAEDKDPSGLLHGVRLADAEERLRANSAMLSAGEQSYIEASSAAQQAALARQVEERRRREEAERKAERTHKERLEAETRAARQLAQRTQNAALVMAGLALVAAGIGYFAYDRSLEAERQRSFADAGRLEAERQRNQALRAQSLYLAALSRQQTAAGNATNGILLAMEALPSQSQPRPYVAQAEAALYRALVAHREKQVFGRLEERVTFAAFSPDGRRLMTVYEKGAVLVWAVESGERLLALNDHRAPVNHASFSPNGEQLVTATEDGSATVWDSGSGKRLMVLWGHQAQVYQAAFSPDGRKIVTSSGDETARVWDAENGELLVVLEDHEAWVSHAGFSPDGQRIITASGDSTARLWNAQDGALLVKLAHEAWVQYAAFSPDGLRVITVSKDGTTRIWGALSGEPEVVLGKEAWVHQATLDSDGLRLVTALADGTARVWDAKDGKPLNVLKSHGTWVSHAMFDPDGKRIVTGSGDGSLRVWDPTNGKLLMVLRGHEDQLYHVQFSADKRHLVTVSKDGTARLWNTAAPMPLNVLKGHQGRLDQVRFSPDANWLIAGFADGIAQLWDVHRGEFLILRGHKARVGQTAFSPDGRRVLTASGDGTTRLWDTATAKPLLILGDYLSWVKQSLFSPDGVRIITVYGNGLTRLWDAENGSLVTEIEGLHVNHAEFSPDGRQFLTASEDGVARLWDTRTGQEIRVLKGHEKRLYHAAFSPDGKRIVTASGDATARIWAAKKDHPLTVLKSHHGWMSYAAFSPDGQTLITVRENGPVQLWDLASGEVLREFADQSGGIHSTAFSPDGRRVLTVSRAGTATLWDAETGESLVVLGDGHLTDAAFSPDGRRIVTASEDGSARIWSVLPQRKELWTFADRIVTRRLTRQQRKRFFLE